MVVILRCTVLAAQLNVERGQSGGLCQGLSSTCAEVWDMSGPHHIKASIPVTDTADALRTFVREAGPRLGKGACETIVSAVLLRSDSKVEGVALLGGVPPLLSRRLPLILLNSRPQALKPEPSTPTPGLQAPTHHPSTPDPQRQPPPNPDPLTQSPPPQSSSTHRTQTSSPPLSPYATLDVPAPPPSTRRQPSKPTCHEARAASRRPPHPGVVGRVPLPSPRVPSGTACAFPLRLQPPRSPRA